jgi:glycylpeptide N-tetradecanoyltransferase
LAPTLIKEVTRRVNLHGIFQAVYTAGIKLPKPITTARYHHRTLNPKKLVDIGFTSIPRDLTMQKMIKKYKLPNAPALPGIQVMTAEDVPQVTKLLNAYLLKFKLAPSMTEEEVLHWQLPIDKVVYSYVVKEGETVTDFVSFYSLPSSVSGNTEHSHLEAAYLFYYTPKGLGEDKGRTRALLHDALILAKNVIVL